jgi:hypothetical protein
MGYTAPRFFHPQIGEYDAERLAADPDFYLDRLLAERKRMAEAAQPQPVNEEK